MNPRDRLVFALDVPSEREADFLIGSLADHVGAFKIGSEAFLVGGPTLIRNTVARAPVVLDLKTHDIPETVERTFLRAADLGVRYFTVHSQQRATLERVSRVAEKTLTVPLCVTVLTSMTTNDLSELGLSETDPAILVQDRADHAWSCGMRGFVCSPQEVSILKQRGGKDIFMMVPGIRYERRKGDELADDQRRTATPYRTIRDGANLIVVGRPIRDALDPREAARGIVSDIEAALEERASQKGSP